MPSKTTYKRVKHPILSFNGQALEYEKDWNYRGRFIFIKPHVGSFTTKIPYPTLPKALKATKKK